MPNLWSSEEDFILILRRTTQRLETIGRKIGRPASAVYARAHRIGCWPTTGDLLTSTQAAQIAGCSPQWLTKLARAKRIKARRVPGGRWWLFDEEEIKCIR